jgi:hypothetical protein
MFIGNLSGFYTSMHYKKVEIYDHQSLGGIRWLEKVPHVDRWDLRCASSWKRSILWSESAYQEQPNYRHEARKTTFDNNLIVLVTQNLIGSFDFGEVFFISYTITCRDVTMQSSFFASTILLRVMQNPLFLSKYSSNNVIYNSIN